MKSALWNRNITEYHCCQSLKGNEILFKDKIKRLRAQSRDLRLLFMSSKSKLSNCNLQKSNNYYNIIIVTPIMMTTKTIFEETIWTPFLWLLNENYGKTNKVFTNSFGSQKLDQQKISDLFFYNFILLQRLFGKVWIFSWFPHIVKNCCTCHCFQKSLWWWQDPMRKWRIW